MNQKYARGLTKPFAFVDLNDVPEEYTGKDGFVVVVDENNNKLIFVNPTDFTYINTNPSVLEWFSA